MSDKKPRKLSLEEVSERTGIPLGKLQEQQAARQSQSQSLAPVAQRIERAGAAAGQVVSSVDEQPSWWKDLKNTASTAMNKAAQMVDGTVAMGRDLGQALDNAGTENSLPNQRLRRLEDSMKL